MKIRNRLVTAASEHGTGMLSHLSFRAKSRNLSLENSSFEPHALLRKNDSEPVRGPSVAVATSG